jgi:hypothetical protein
MYRIVILRPFPAHIESSELQCPKAALVLHVLELQLLKSVPKSVLHSQRSFLAPHNQTEYSLLALSMEINPAHFTPHLVKADIVKPLKARAIDGPHPMIGNKEVLLPPHENVLPLRDILND